MGRDTPCRRKVLYLEKLFAALLLAGRDVLPALRTRRREVESRHTAVVMAWKARKWSRSASMAHVRGGSEEEAEPVVSLELRVLRGLESLLAFYVPALFGLGVLVRQCTWEGRPDQSVKGDVARKVLEQTLAILVHLYSDWEAKEEYVRTIAVALMLWEPWFSNLPGCCFVEESCEAMLSRMRARVDHFRVLTGFENAQDLFMTLPLAKLEERATGGGIRSELQSVFRSRLSHLLLNTEGLPFASWSSTGVARWTSTYPSAFTFPCDVPVEVDNALVERLLQGALVNVTGSVVVSPDVVAFCELT